MRGVITGADAHTDAGPVPDYPYRDLRSAACTTVAGWVRTDLTVQAAAPHLRSGPGAIVACGG
jgi:hypothetical protein